MEEKVLSATQCSHFDECSAPICPLDGESIKHAVWYPNEEICRSNIHGRLLWVKKQRKISRKVRNKDFYFTHEMLCRNCRITAATEGLDPDKTDFNDRQAVKKWLDRHPEKRPLTEEEKGKIRLQLGKFKKKPSRGYSDTTPKDIP